VTDRHTILVIDDHPVVLKGVRDLLGSSSDFRIVGEAITGKDGLELARSLQPNLVILDLRLPDAVAPNLCAQLRQLAPYAKVVILTAFDDRPLIQACLNAGVSGVLLKDLDEEDLLTKLRRLLVGETVVDERVLSGELKRGRSIQTDSASPYVSLTAREYDVLRLLAQGLTSKEIGCQLALSTNTVRGYTQSVLTKLQAHTRIQALATARKLRLI